MPQILNYILCSFWGLQPCVTFNIQPAGVRQSEPTHRHVWLVVFCLSAFLPLCCSQAEKHRDAVEPVPLRAAALSR